jgi:hypothetical protein
MNTHDTRHLPKRLQRAVRGALVLVLRDVDHDELEGDVLLRESHEKGGDSASGVARGVNFRDHGALGGGAGGGGDDEREERRGRGRGRVDYGCTRWRRVDDGIRPYEAARTK